MITFNGIPTDIRRPGSYVEFSNVRTQNGLAAWSTQMLVVGQMLGTGSSQPLVKTLITSAAQAVKLYGAGSQLAMMCAAALACNGVTPLWALPVADNGAGVAATKTVTVSEAPTGAGTLALYIGGQQVEVAVGATDSEATVATNIAAAINALNTLPCTAAAAAAVVTVTCNWKGLTGNDIDIRTNYYASDVMPAGLALTVAVGTAGAGNPVGSAVIAAFGNTWWNFIVWPWTDGANLAALATEMANRRGPLEMIEGVAFSSAKGSQGTLASLGATLNSADLSISEATGPATTWERAARDAATIALYGTIDPARPFQTLALIGDIAPNDAEAFNGTEREALLHDGISTHTVDAGGNVDLERPITTYQFNAAGLPDTSYLDVNTMLTLGYLRYTFRARIAQKFPRMKLADNGIAVAPGQAIVTPAILTAELIALAGDWETAGLVENLDEFAQLLLVQRNASDPSRVDAIIPPDIVSGLRVVAAQIQFDF